MWEKIVLNLALQRLQVHVRGRDRGVAAAGRARGASSRCATPARASRPRSCRGCSSASTASRARAAGPTKAAASGSRWCRSWCRLHGGTVSVESERRARQRVHRHDSARQGAPARRPHRSRRAPWRRRRRARRLTSRRRCAGCPTRARTERGASGCSAHRRERRASTPPPHDCPPRVVLLADDNADMRDYVRAAARAAGYEVEPSRTARRRWRRHARASPISCSPTS